MQQAARVPAVAQSFSGETFFLIDASRVLLPITPSKVLYRTHITTKLSLPASMQAPTPQHVDID
jgi:hypothetical protein